MRVLGRFQRLVEPGELRQLGQLVGITRDCPLFLRELVPRCLLGDASLQRALCRVASQVIRAFIATSFKKSPSFFQTKSSQILEIRTLELQTRSV